MIEKNNLNGFLVVDKPYQMGSTKVVAILKHFLHPTKIGHAGTLDPLATGVLPIAFGKATRLIPYVMAGKKTYQFTIKWGEETASDDLGTEVVATSDKRPTENEILSVLPRFSGRIMQTPNVFSALRVDGKRAYELARAGQEVVLQARPVDIYALRLLACDETHAAFEAECSKGTYIRTLAHDIAHALETVGVVTVLRRTACAVFDLRQACSMDLIQKGAVTPADIDLIPMEKAVAHLPVLELTACEADRLSMGQRLSWLKLDIAQQEVPDGIYVAQVDSAKVGLVKKEAFVVSPEFIWK